MKRVVFVFALIALFATAGFAWDQAALELALEAENPTAAQKQLLEEYSDWQDSQNQNVIDHMGGPDGFGYVFKDSQEPDGPAYNWVDNTATGTEFILANGLTDENMVGPFPIGTGGETFTFYGVDYTDWYFESNGVLVFSDTDPTGDIFGLSDENLPTDDAPWAAIFPFWDDMDAADGCTGYYSYEMVGAQMATVITVLDLDEYPDGPDQDNLDFQIQLFADGTFLVQYREIAVDLDIASETIGIQAGSAGPALEASYHLDPDLYPFDNLAIMFEQLDPDASLEGTVTDMDSGNPIEGATVSFGAMETATDVNGFYSFPDLYSGTMETLSVSAFGYFDYSADVTLAAGVNVEDVMLEAMPVPDYFTSFEDDQGPFVDDGMGEWEWGMPMAGDLSHPGPGAAYQGSNAWATKLDTVHTDTGGDRWLYSTMSWDIGVGASVQYYHWFDYNDDYDGYNFKISIDGGTTWETLQPAGGYSGFCSYTGFTDEEVFFNDEVPPTPGQEEWALVTYDLSAYAGEEVMFAFHHIASTVVSYYGVAIDDFGVFLGSPPPPAAIDVTITEGATVPAAGGTILFDLYLENNTGEIAVANLWLSATLPNSNVYNIWNYAYTFLPGFAMGEDMTVDVPAFAPEGAYMLNANIGVYPNNPLFSDSEPFTKEAAAGVASAADPQLSGSRPVLHGTAISGDAAEVTEALPAEFELGNAYPNPFNPSASFTISLPEAADLNVRVFNVMGQQVAELANARTAAGTHTFTFDGSQLSSGIYFIQAQVPGELNAIQKVTLMK